MIDEMINTIRSSNTNRRSHIRINVGESNEHREQQQTKFQDP